MKITIYTDGASRGNPGNGGWGVYIEVLKLDEEKKQKLYVQKLSGNEKDTTNNKMELVANIKAFKYVKTNLKKIFENEEVKMKKDLNITIKLDSEYVRKGITEWIKNWEKNNWKTASKKPVVNKEIWQDLLKLKNEINQELKNNNLTEINFDYVAGHSGIKGNEIADELATTAADKINFS